MTTKKKPPIKKAKESTAWKLSPRHETFCREYLVDLNASQAAIRAGYSKAAAGALGYDLLQIPKVAARVKQLMDERAARVQITQDRVLRELARLAFSDLRQAFREDGTLKLPHEWDDDTAAAMAGVDTTTSSVGGDDSPITLTTKKVKVFDKSAALTLAMRHLGMLNDKLEVTMPTVRIKDYTGRA